MSGTSQHRAWLLALCLCAAAALVLLRPRASVIYADGPVTPDGYRLALDRTIALVDQASAEPMTSQRQDLLQQAASQLEAVSELQLDTGRREAIDNRVLIAQLRDKAPTADGIKAVRARLSALRTAIGQPAAQLDPGDQAKLRDVFARPPFTQAAPDNWLIQWIDDLLRRLLGGTARGVFDNRYLIVGAGILLIAIVLVYFAMNLRRNLVSEAELPGSPESGEAHLTSSAALSLAQRLAGAGDYRSAVRQLYLSTLLLMDERGRLRYDRSLTNREYLRAIAGSPVLRDALRPVVDTFDRIWYGYAPIGEHEFELYRTQVETLQNL